MPASALAQSCTPIETQKLIASDGAAGDNFGNSSAVEINGDALLVGSRYHIGDAFEDGAAYVFRRSNGSWSEEAKLSASDGDESDWFGWGVALEGDTAIVGAFQDDDNGENSGSAYVFEFDGTSWVETQKLLPSDGAEGDAFGRNVDIDGDVAIIGAMTADVGAEANAGKAYVFRYDGTNWVEEAILSASDGIAGAAFGQWCSVENDTIFIGVPYDQDQFTSSGSAYVFEYDGTNWNETQKLTAPDGEQMNSVYGNWVESSGDIAVVASVYRDTFAGAVYVYRNDGSSWNFEQRLEAPDREDRDFFGYVTIEDGVIVVGARSDDDIADGSGAAYVFEHDGASWVNTHKLKASSPQPSDTFGWGVSISEGTLVVSAKNDDDNGSDAGAVYVFDMGCGFECLADVNGDGMLSPTDFTAWVGAYNSNAPECDQNGDGSCSPTDFTAWITNFNAGCY